MLIDKAKQLATEHGFDLRPGATQWSMDLFVMDRVSGSYVDTLPVAQIHDLREEDFVDYYLN
jgi:hypothetical protein